MGDRSERTVAPLSAVEAGGGCDAARPGTVSLVLRAMSVASVLLVTSCSTGAQSAEQHATSASLRVTVLSADEAWVLVDLAWDGDADETTGCAGLLADHRDQHIGVASAQGWAWIDAPVTPASPDVLTDGTDVWVNADIGWDRDEIGSSWVRIDAPDGSPPPESHATVVLLATAIDAELRPDLGVAPTFLEVELHDLWEAVQGDFASVELAGEADLDGVTLQRYELVGDGQRGEALVTADGVLRKLALPALDDDGVALGQPAMTVSLTSRRDALPFELPAQDAPLLSQVGAPDLDLTVDCDLREALGTRLEAPGATIGFAPVD